MFTGANHVRTFRVRIVVEEDLAFAIHARNSFVAHVRAPLAIHARKSFALHV